MLRRDILADLKLEPPPSIHSSDHPTNHPIILFVSFYIFVFLDLGNRRSHRKRRMPFRITVSGIQHFIELNVVNYPRGYPFFQFIFYETRAKLRQCAIIF